MANPVAVICPADTWKKVATNVTIGSIKKLSKKPALYIATYKTTGAAAPSSKLAGNKIFMQDDEESISSSSAIDVYVMAIGRAGKIRVDL